MAGKYTFDSPPLGELLKRVILPIGKLSRYVVLGQISFEPDAIVVLLRRLGAQMVKITDVASAEKLLLHWSKNSEQFVEYLQSQAAGRASHTINAEDLVAFGCLSWPPPPD
jgi:hypothetical protein